MDGWARSSHANTTSPCAVSPKRCASRSRWRTRGASRTPERADMATKQPGVEPDQTPESLDECRRCALWEHATQAVPGKGPRHAPMMIVGEQPGDQEDLQGKPFVGPAGAMLRSALRQAGFSDGECYLTNAVKHFKFV